MEASAKIRIHAEKLGDIRKVTQYLQTIEKVYNHLYTMHFIVEDATRRHSELNKGSWREKSIRTIISGKRPDEIVLPEDHLQVSSIIINSPGFWEFLGSLNPLEVLRKYLCDRHERLKDQTYRNRIEEEKGELENEKLRMQVVEEKVNLLRKLGVPEDKIRNAVFKHVIRPLSMLDDFQDKRMIQDAEIISEDENPKPKGTRVIR
jgi:hypothetical protein